MQQDSASGERLVHAQENTNARKEDETRIHQLEEPRKIVFAT